MRFDTLVKLPFEFPRPIRTPPVRAHLSGLGPHAKARALVAEGADLSSTDGGSWRHTPLHQAAFHGRYEMAKTYVAMNFVHHLTNFRRLVCGCMDSYDSEQSHILQHFSSSTR